MTVATTPLLIAAFRDHDHAGRLLAGLRHDRTVGAGGILDAAALTWDDARLCRITDSWERDDRGMYVGGVVATFIACLAGPAMATTASGTVLGGLRGRLQSAPLKFELLAIGHELPPGASLLLSALAPGWTDLLGREMFAEATLILSYELRGSVVERLDDGGGVTFPLPPNGTRRAADDPRASLAGADHPGDHLTGEEAILVSCARRNQPAPVAQPVRRGAGTAAAMATSGEA